MKIEGFNHMKEIPKKKRQRLAVDIPIEIHQKLKFIGVLRNCSMRKLVLRALIAFIKYEEKFQ